MSPVCSGKLRGACADAILTCSPEIFNRDPNRPENELMMSKEKEVLDPYLRRTDNTITSQQAARLSLSEET
jgi:hypothetical protein